MPLADMTAPARGGEVPPSSTKCWPTIGEFIVDRPVRCRHLRMRTFAKIRLTRLTTCAGAVATPDEPVVGAAPAWNTSSATSTKALWLRVRGDSRRSSATSRCSGRRSPGSTTQDHHADAGGHAENDDVESDRHSVRCVPASLILDGRSQIEAPPPNVECRQQQDRSLRNVKRRRSAFTAASIALRPGSRSEQGQDQDGAQPVNGHRYRAVAVSSALPHPCLLRVSGAAP